MKKGIALCILALLLGGCGGGSKKKTWVHPEKSTAALVQDEAQCNYDIGMANAQRPIPSDQRQELFNNCLKAKGWLQQ